MSGYNSDYVTISRYDIVYTIPRGCLSRKARYEISQALGIGVTSSVFRAYIEGSDRRWIIRIAPLNVNIPNTDCDIKTNAGFCTSVKTKDFLEEADITQRLGDAGIAPKVFDYWVCSDPNTGNPYQGHLDLGFIIMEEYDIPLSEYIKLYPDDFFRQYDAIMNRIQQLGNYMEQLNICHQDAHPGNVMVNYDHRTKDIYDLRFIDFGVVGPCSIPNFTYQLFEMNLGHYLRGLGM